MSLKKGSVTPGGSANPAIPASLTPAQVQEWQFVLKKLEDNKWVVPAVITAGAAGALEIAHIIWLAARFIYFHLSR
jgi:hypothetical protein